MATRVTLNTRGLDAALNTAGAKRAVAVLAEKVADNARAAAPDVEGIPGDIPLPVRVDVYETDRARAEVWLAHPSGLAVQAKHGLLTRAASQAGLEVKS
jgi:hypothetical protein